MWQRLNSFGSKREMFCFKLTTGLLHNFKLCEQNSTGIPEEKKIISEFLKFPFWFSERLFLKGYVNVN